MKTFLLLSFILLSSSFYQCLSATCGGLDCGAGPCCLDRNRPVCYSSSTHTCAQHSSGYMLCGAKEGVCGSASQPYCYNTDQYNCINGQLQQKPAGSGSSTSAKASTSSSSSSSSSSTTGKSTTTGSSTGGCGSNNANCGSMSCCLAPSGTGMCYSPSAYSCTAGTLCPPGYQGCGQACYHPSQYSCVNGQLTQTGSAGSTTGQPSTPAPSTTPAPTTTTTTVKPATTGGSTTGGSRTPVKLWGINYSPRRPAGHCPSLAEVEADLRVLETITYRIRIYSIVDCNAGQLVLQALKNTNVNLRLTLGLWLDQWHREEFPNELASLKSLLDSGMRLDKVDDYIVGSETQYRNNFDWSILVGYMQNITATLNSYGYSNIDVVTSDVIYNLINSPILNYENVVYVNQFPFWEGAHVNDARQLLATTVDNLRARVGNKQIIIGETGWPTGGDNFGASVPTSNNLNTYLQHVVCFLHQQGTGYFWFSAFDEPFREDKNGGVERYFGVFNSDRTPKAGVQVPVMCPV